MTDNITLPLDPEGKLSVPRNSPVKQDGAGCKVFVGDQWFSVKTTYAQTLQLLEFGQLPKKRELLD